MARPRTRFFWLLAAASGINAAQHTVQVARDGLAFDPETLVAKAGDVITYTFFSGEHSVTQTTAEDPCRPLASGFHSGSVPARDGQSPVTWRIVVNETEPIYLYSGYQDSCRQGMVQVINPPSGDASLSDLKTSASSVENTASASNTPRGGQRILNIDVGRDSELSFSPSHVEDQLAGTIVQFRFYPQNNSVVQTTYDRPCQPLSGGFSSGFIPIESASADVGFSIVLNDTDPVYFYDAQPTDSHCQNGMVGSINAWGGSLSNATESFLQLLQYTDNMLLETLLYGTTRLTDGGEWEGVFPPTILEALSSTAAQAYIHRTVATTPLRHFGIDIPKPCAYRLPLGTVESFLSTLRTLLLVEIGLYIDFLASDAAGDDAWLAPALASALGAKSRAAGLINMMQNKPAAATVGEALLPSKLAYSFLAARYVSLCSGNDQPNFGKVLPGMQVWATETSPNGGRVMAVDLDFQGSTGPSTDGSAEVPGHLYGHVWAVACGEDGLTADAVAEKALAGPEIVWVAQP
ncbi:unnamed protein product [Parascedosporium putredinis]|uniref:Uncharacterized protein n=1 Tax=Parascedosporium putredinis TaxID=1442378 RepID=A0A9P1H3W7_9PEZI|nr:unnamed protein product [Parascedosporium putredinis]CAI7995167.1 unnamed protein product [Parascedosporium putredinis]